MGQVILKIVDFHELASLSQAFGIEGSLPELWRPVRSHGNSQELLQAFGSKANYDRTLRAEYREEDGFHWLKVKTLGLSAKLVIDRARTRLVEVNFGTGARLVTEIVNRRADVDEIMRSFQQLDRYLRPVGTPNPIEKFDRDETRRRIEHIKGAVKRTLGDRAADFG